MIKNLLLLVLAVGVIGLAQKYMGATEEKAALQKKNEQLQITVDQEKKEIDNLSQKISKEDSLLKEKEL